MTNTLVKYINQADVTILPDNKQYKNRFEIKSETSNKLYTIAQRKTDNVWRCSCFGCIRYGKCKHLTTLEPLFKELQETESKQLS